MLDLGAKKCIPCKLMASTIEELKTVVLFITIALVGIICALLGSMLGDVGPYWTILVGAILIWVAPRHAWDEGLFIVRNRSQSPRPAGGSGALSYWALPTWTASRRRTG